MKDGILLINKEKNMTSRDVCNKLMKKINMRKIGHTGTLDPIATGLMVIALGEGLKLVELLTDHDKEYIAKVKIGLKTDKNDILGNVLKEGNYNLDKDKLLEALNYFKKTYDQEVPIYSSVKINGKKLYEYARSNTSVDLPKRKVTIYDIELLDLNDNDFTIRTKVSKGTYIRSLINDIGLYLNIPLAMMELTRTKVDKFDIKDSKLIDDIELTDLISIKDALSMETFEITSPKFYKMVSNGTKIKNLYNKDKILYLYQGKEVAIYVKKDDLLVPYKVFKI